MSRLGILLVGYLTWVHGVQYIKWSPPGSSSSHMYCPATCSEKSGVDRDQQCCYCDAKPCWELDDPFIPCEDSLQPLLPEYIDVKGSVILFPNPSQTSTLYEFVLRKGRLSAFPLNVCNFNESLVKLDLRQNSLSEMTSVGCLTGLDTLKLDFNKIKSIPSGIFAHMRRLRIFTAANNLISTLAPHTLDILEGNLASVDLSNNHFKTLDLTNVFRPGPFCKLDLIGCSVDEQTNLSNYSFVEADVIHGPGDVILDNSKSDIFLNLTIVGLPDYSELSRYVHGRYDYKNSSLYCDCNLYPILAHTLENADVIWPDVLDESNVICKNPEKMKGVDLFDFTSGRVSLELLTCDIAVNCPYPCDCVQISARNVIVVNCSSRNLDEMPGEMPVGSWGTYRIELLASDNDISRLDYREYLARTVFLDLSRNSLRGIQREAVLILKRSMELNVSGQVLESLPREMQLLHPLNIDFGSNPVKCDCSNLWIGDWVRLKNGHGRLLGQARGIVMPAEAVDADYLLCNIVNENALEIMAIICCVFLAIAVITAFTLYYFRLELFLIRRYIYGKAPEVGSVFISFCDDNDSLFDWLEHEALPSLEDAGYSLLVPWYDVNPGEEKRSKVASLIEQSTTFIVILCRQYFSTDGCVFEFDTLWKKFEGDTSRRIIVVNFDTLDAGDIRDARARAFRRVRLDINYEDRQEKILETLKRRIGRASKVTNGLIDRVGKESMNVVCESERCEQHKGRQPTVFDRLAAPKQQSCNCKYRKCYVQGFHRRHRSLSVAPVIEVKPASKVDIGKSDRQSVFPFYV